ncbi:MAG: hypothetical protein FD180_611 [Planctomycetota bacterium]|nr:MAG: hypothetical protein FD180_611 [Planctomycetota bacterium]
MGIPDSEPDSRPPAATLTPDLKTDIEMWLSHDVTKRNGSLVRIIALGATAARALVETMFLNARESLRQSQLQNALREIGPPAFQPVAQALGRIPAVKTTTDVALLEDLTELLLSLDGRRAAPVAVEQLAKLGAVPIGNRLMAEHINNARLRLVVKTAGTCCAPEAVEEVLAYLGDGTTLVPLALIEVLEKCGDGRALVPLLRLFPRQNAASEHSGRQISEAFRAIVKREKLAIESEAFAGCGACEKELATRWLAKK